MLGRLLPALAVCTLLLPLGDAEAATKRGKQKASPEVSYSGVLQDENLNPVGGVYPLRFALYKSPTSRRAVWQEKLWVSVDTGRYAVILGRQKKLPRKLKLDKLYIGVSLDGIGEILRERLVAEAPEPEAPPISPVASPPAAGRATSSDTVERSMHAYEADHAANSDKLANLSLEELKKELIVPVKIGRPSKLTNAIGGEGGYAFEEKCPKGYVVTGMKGAAGKFLDSLSLICSPLE